MMREQIASACLDAIASRNMGKSSGRRPSASAIGNETSEDSINALLSASISKTSRDRLMELVERKKVSLDRP